MTIIILKQTNKVLFECYYTNYIPKSQRTQYKLTILIFPFKLKHKQQFNFELKAKNFFEQNSSRCKQLF